MTVIEGLPPSLGPLPGASSLSVVMASDQASENHIGQVGGYLVTPSASFTRPDNTTPYTSGDLVANNTVANLVSPLSFAVARVAGGTGLVRRVRLRMSDTVLTNAQFRLHLYAASPTQTGTASANSGDNAPWLTDQSATYLGALDVTIDKAFTDGASGTGAPLTGTEINFALSTGVTTIYGLLEARAAYAPVGKEVFAASLEVFQN